MSNASPQQLFLAIREGDAAQVASLVAQDPSLLQSADERGSTPLVLASYLGDLSTTKVLVKAGADLNAVGSTGTALMGVSFKGYAEIAAYLLEQGADVNLGTPQGTPLSFAAMFNKPAIISLLLDKGAAAGGKDGRGMTAADYARQHGLTELADRLANH